MSLFEIHCHTGDVSNCGWVDAKRVVQMHKDAGFEGICITDHFHEPYFRQHNELTAKEAIDKYLEGYRSAKAEGDKIGLKVFLGMEIRFPENFNDYLVYGVTEDLLYDNPYMYKMSLEMFSGMSRNNGLLLIQAHPFRDNMTRVNPIFLEFTRSSSDSN